MDRCCGCLGFSFGGKLKKVRPTRDLANHTAGKDFLLGKDAEEHDDDSNGDLTEIENRANIDFRSPIIRSSGEILKYRIQNGLTCRDVPVKETNKLVRSEDEDGNKMINEYVRLHKIGSGSYGKVVLCRSTRDGEYYAVKAFHKSRLLKMRVAPSKTAMADVLHEVMIMKTLKHPNIVNLFEVIDDPTTDHFYMVLEYVEGKQICDGDQGLKPGGVGENTARKYFRDIVRGLMYLHSHNVVHGDIKPENLLVTASGTVKIGDFNVSHVFEGDHDELRRSPGTPVFAAPECCLGQTYHGKLTDTWALGVTLYCVIMGEYPFLGDTFEDICDKIVNDPLELPDGMNPLLKDLIHGLLCRDPEQRLKLESVAEHAWVVGEEGPIAQYSCWCKRNVSEDG